MNVALARTQYRKAESTAAAEQDNPHRIIEVTLRELERSVQVLIAARAAGRSYPDDHLNRGLTAVYILQSSLDFEAGAEIATSLFQVYEFVRIQVLKAFRREPDAQLDDALLAVTEILSAWREIRDQVG
ncbi:flagellar biosynthesis protein FliS [Meridianimarinicoccus roseus]|jgi:flagellar protein FliS|uniref:Flagellar biosynthesis protein FliS n=1 Tax=Meridianimarinicoccus roseus TaxID=2072018 RepID=A0A2V2LJS3_9RHOB|nr:flagellar protein FliS [Meridianimarinicoccus roseus]PWR02589.1 flagellar biosynthesis protein FliS [Meridianimarinicoccus roseus]